MHSVAMPLMAVSGALIPASTSIPCRSDARAAVPAKSRVPVLD